MHPQGILRLTLMLPFGAAISTAVFVRKPGVPPSSGAPDTSKQNTDVLDRGQPLAAVTTATIYVSRALPDRARDRAVRFSGQKRETIAQEDGSTRHVTHNENTEQAGEEKHGGTRTHRRDMAGMATAGFAILVGLGGIASFVLVWFTIIYAINHGKTAVIR